jgi:hypothetical protein
MSTRHRTHRTRTRPAPPVGPGGVAHASAVLPEQLRRAAGYRIDGPEGRIGTLRALVPGDLGADPHLRVDVGLFVPTQVGIPLADVRGIDAKRRRVLVSRAPRIPRRGRASLARRVRSFLRVARA